VFMFTKPMVTLAARTRFYGDGHRWSGVNPESIGVRRRIPPVVRRRAGAREA
jgi:preprotein translocase subunit SecD